MNVREMIAMLSTFDPEAKVVVEYDDQYRLVKAVQPQMMLTEGASWGDYQGIQALDTEDSLYPPSMDEQLANQTSPREIVVAIWGSAPPEGLCLPTGSR